MTLFALVAEPRAVTIILAADPVALVAARRRSDDDAVLMAILAGRDEVPPFQRKTPRLVESARGAGLPRRVDDMAVLARRAELTAMWIVMTRSATGEAGKALGEASLRAVAAGTRGGRMLAAEERSRLAMDVLLDTERPRRMTAVARGAEPSRMRILVTRGARKRRSAIAGLMALTAGDVLVPAGQGELRLRVIEEDWCEFRRIDGMTVGALRELPRVYVAVTGRAFGREVLVEPRLQRPAMTLLAPQRCVLPAEKLRESRMVVARDPE